MYHKFHFIFYSFLSLGIFLIESSIRWIASFLGWANSVTKHSKGKGNANFEFIQPFDSDKVQSNLSNRIVIVTGSNTGIGKATATALAMHGATVILACRDSEKGTAAANEINLKLRLFSLVPANQTEKDTDKLLYPHALKGKAVFLRLDLCDLHSVLDFAQSFKQQYNRLDILINNAGINNDGVLPNGLQQLFQVNYLGHFLLYRCLENELRLGIHTNQNFTARVINLSSVCHHFGQGNFKVSAFRKYPWFMKYISMSSYYDDSKLYMNLLTMEINRRNDELQQRLNDVTLLNSEGVASSPRKRSTAESSVRPVHAISVNPGAVASDIWRHIPFSGLFHWIVSFVFLNVEEGARTSIFAAMIHESLLREYRKDENLLSSDQGVQLGYYKDVPYFMPYKMYWSALFFEMIGYAVRTPDFSPVTLPASSVNDREKHIDPTLQVTFQSPKELSTKLWEFSGSLCHRILLQSGVSEDEIEFLMS